MSVPLHSCRYSSTQLRNDAMVHEEVIIRLERLEDENGDERRRTCVRVGQFGFSDDWVSFVTFGAERDNTTPIQPKLQISTHLEARYSSQRPSESNVFRPRAFSL